MFNNLNDATLWINNSKRSNKKYDLKDLRDALGLLDNPIKDMKFIHIGGTNGKGSTSSYTANILIKHGYKVGLYISPYVIKFNERISINNEYISDDDLLRLINFIYDFNEKFKKNHVSLSFFELVTLIAFIYFKENNCDFVVLEVGLGGRLDATNVVTPLVSAITNIQKDHMHILGNTYKKILMEKLGIVKENIPFVSTIKRRELIPIIKDYTASKNSEYIRVNNIRNIKVDETGTYFNYKNNKYHSSLIGTHQAYNASLSIEIINTLNRYYNLNITDCEIKMGLSSTFWPGRFEILDKNIIIDGGHNKEGLLALKNTLSKYTKKNIITVFNAMKDKELDKMIEIVDSFSKKIIFTHIDYYRSTDSTVLTKHSQCKDIISFDDYKEAIKYALKIKKDDDLLVFTGSLYFISKIRSYFKE